MIVEKDSPTPHHSGHCNYRRTACHRTPLQMVSYAFLAGFLGRVYLAYLTWAEGIRTFLTFISTCPSTIKFLSSCDSITWKWPQRWSPNSEAQAYLKFTSTLGSFGRQPPARATETKINKSSRKTVHRERAAPCTKMLSTEKTNGSFTQEPQVRTDKGRRLEPHSLVLVLKLCFWGYHLFNTMGTVCPGILSHGDLGWLAVIHTTAHMGNSL